MRRVNSVLHAGDYIYMDPSDGSKKRPKLKPSAEWAYGVISVDRRANDVEREPRHESVYIFRSLRTSIVRDVNYL